MTKNPFLQNVAGQIALLNEGKPLVAFDKYFSATGVMYANGQIFARGAVEARKKQEPYINAATSIHGKIVGLVVSEKREICAFLNQSSFEVSGGRKHQIDGLCWQSWLDGKVIEERYFDGDDMRKMLNIGILISPEKIE